MEEPAFCAGCGQPVARCGGGCGRAGPLDPARYCPRCGHRLDVQVFPDRVDTSCRECRRRARSAAGA